MDGTSLDALDSVPETVLQEKVFTQTQKMNEYCRIIELVCQAWHQKLH